MDFASLLVPLFSILLVTSHPVKAQSSVHEPPVVFNATDRQNASVIVIHGIVDTGEGLSSTIAGRLGPGLPFAKFLFPTALEIPVALYGNRTARAWFNLYTVTDLLNAPEDTTNLQASSAYIQSLVEQEIQAGVPSNRIIVAGFSQGGVIALLSLRQPVSLGGVVSMSGWLTLRNAGLYSTQNQATPVLMCHGSNDSVVKIADGQESFEILKNSGLNVTFKEYPGLDHAMSSEELADVNTWLKQRLS